MEGFAIFQREHLRSYREAAGWAAQFEFFIRATAQALWGVGRGTAKDLEEIYDSIVRELRPSLTADQLSKLAAVNRCHLRDDIIHGRMSKAYGKLGGKSNGAAVADVASIEDGEHVLDAINRAVAGDRRPIVQTKSSDSGVAMWLRQMAASGFFSQAVEVFEEGCDILSAGLQARADAELASRRG